MRVYNNHIYHAVSYISSNSFCWLVLRTIHSTTSKKTIAALFSTLLGLDLNWACGIKFSVLGTCREGRNPWTFFWSHKKQVEGLYWSHMLHVLYIYLHLGDFARAHVGKYTSTMEHMGMVSCQQESFADWDSLQDSTAFTSKGRQCSVSWFWMRTSLRPKTQNA